MFSLTYTSAYDPYHTVFRMLAISAYVDTQKPLLFDTVRIVDFYHNFPWLLGDFQSFSRIKGFQKDKNKIVKNYPKSKFEVLPDKHIVFQRMLPSQLSAKSALAGIEVVSIEGDELTYLTTGMLSARMQKVIGDYRSQHEELLTFLAEKLSQVPLFGAGGLKDRSGLGEFRYDIV